MALFSLISLVSTVRCDDGNNHPVLGEEVTNPFGKSAKKVDPNNGSKIEIKFHELIED